MAMTLTTPLQTLQARFGAALTARLPDHLDRLGWDAEQLAAHQRDRLRILLAHAVARSPFHAPRLRDMEPQGFELEQLAELPVMSKDEMMDAFDDVATEDGASDDVTTEDGGSDAFVRVVDVELAPVERSSPVVSQAAAITTKPAK